MNTNSPMVLEKAVCKKALVYSGPADALCRALRKCAFKGLTLASEADRAKIQRELDREGKRSETMRILGVTNLRNGGIA